MMHIEMRLTDGAAWALAEFLKRAGYSEYRQLAANELEAQEMQEAAAVLRTALAEKGIAPR